MNKVIPPDAVLIPEGSNLAFKGEIFEVYEWQQSLFDDTTRTFEMLKRSDTSTAICIVEDKILILDDEQPHVGIRIGFPGGSFDDEDEDALAAAKREVLEETGYKFKNWRLIKVMQPYGKIEWFVNLFVAWGEPEQASAHLDPGEKITVHHRSLQEVKDLIKAKTSHLGEHADIFEDVNMIEDLINKPEYQGQQVDR
jgi:ADP-ribose pyrophosphatase